MGALKRAWDKIYDRHPDMDLCFFGGRSNTLKDLLVVAGKLSAGNRKLKRSLEFTSGGLSEIDPDSYDIFLVYGLGFYVRDLPDDKRFSSSFLAEFASERVRNSVSYNLISSLRAITKKTIYVGHVPLASRAEGSDVGVEWSYESAFEIFKSSLSGFGDVTLVKQPGVTIVEGFYTKVDYTQGSRRMAVGAANDNVQHPETDFGHMNDDFGEIWLTEFFKYLS